MAYEKTSHFITPTRLTKSATFYATVKMLKTVSPEFKIVLPDATLEWLRKGNWKTISPENVALCMEHSDYSINIDWATDIPLSQKILDACIKHFSKKVPDALSNKFIKEETVTTFIETSMAERAAKHLDLKDEQKRRKYGEDVDKFLEHMAACLRNDNIKTYQIELLWKLMRKDLYPLFLDSFVETTKLVMTPDYIFEEILKRRIKNDGDNWRGSDKTVEIFREGMRRGMLTRNESKVITVPSQPRPSFEKPKVAVAIPSLEVASVKPFTKGKVIFDGRTYRVTL